MQFRLGKLFRKLFKKKGINKPELKVEIHIEEEPIDPKIDQEESKVSFGNIEEEINVDTSFEKIFARDTYLIRLAEEAHSRIENAIARNFKTTRVKLDMVLLAGSYKGVEDAILEHCDYARNVNFKKIKDDYYAIIRISFDSEKNCYTTRKELLK